MLHLSDAVKELAQETLSHSMIWESPTYGGKVVTQTDVMQWRNGMREYLIKVRAALDTFRVNTVETMLLGCSSDDAFRSLIQKRLVDEATDVDRVCPAFVLFRQVLTPGVVSTLTRLDFTTRFYRYFLTGPQSYGPWLRDAKTNMTKRVIELQQQQQGRSSDDIINLVEPISGISTQSPQHVCDESSPQSKELWSDVNASSTAAVNPVGNQDCSAVAVNPLATSSISSPMAEDEDRDETVDEGSDETSPKDIIADRRAAKRTVEPPSQDVGVVTHSGEPASQDDRDRGADSGEFDHKRQRADCSECSGEQSFV